MSEIQVHIYVTLLKVFNRLESDVGGKLLAGLRDLGGRTVKFDAYMSRSRARKVQITAGSVGRCRMDQLFIKRWSRAGEESLSKTSICAVTDKCTC
jgi:hypothetical protein